MLSGILCLVVLHKGIGAVESSWELRLSGILVVLIGALVGGGGGVGGWGVGGGLGGGGGRAV